MRDLEDVALELKRITALLFLTGSAFPEADGDAPAPPVAREAVLGIAEHLERVAADLETVIENKS